MELTACENCDNVHEQSRKQSPRSWLCVKFPRLENLNAVAPTLWVHAEPYNRCANINLGHCPLFTKRRDGQQEFPVGDTGLKAPKRNEPQKATT